MEIACEFSIAEKLETCSTITGILNTGNFDDNSPSQFCGWI
jgi:hypothetical protein